MRRILILGLKLFAIAAVAGLALGATNMVTSGPIAQQAVVAADAARRSVLPTAVTFTELTAPEGLQNAYAGYDAAGKLTGKTGTIVTKGYGGEIEITVGVDLTGTVTGVSVGGSSFAETAGLGARAKETWFGEQFVGQRAVFGLVLTAPPRPGDRSQHGAAPFQTHMHFRRGPNQLERFAACQFAKIEKVHIG